jgi:hypothetical protein
MGKEPSAAGGVQGCRIFSLRLSTRRNLRHSTLKSNFTLGSLRRRGYPFKFAHLSRDVSSTYGSHNAQLNMMDRVGNLTIKQSPR